jgi:hypothetical protein
MQTVKTNIDWFDKMKEMANHSRAQVLPAILKT